MDDTILYFYVECQGFVEIEWKSDILVVRDEIACFAVQRKNSQGLCPPSQYPRAETHSGSGSSESTTAPPSLTVASISLATSKKRKRADTDEEYRFIDDVTAVIKRNKLSRKILDIHCDHVRSCSAVFQ
jgi:hypothetical protein